MVQLPEPGADWGGFRIDREIGRGPRGRTYAAFDDGARRTRALKILMAVPSDDPAGERFQRNPLRASQLDHPNVITAHASSDVDGTAFVLMDLYANGSIADEIGVSVLRMGRAREVLAQVAAAVDAAAAIGMIHGNIKPTNILCGDAGAVVLTDFGCTRFVDDALRAEPVSGDAVAGLPFHEAPEVLTGDRADSRADIYSMTTVLHEMLTGRPPYAGRSPAELTAAHRNGVIPAIGELRPDLPAEFDSFIERGMAKDPANRPGDGAQFLAELDQVIKATLEHRRTQARLKSEASVADDAPEPVETSAAGPIDFEPSAVTAEPATAETNLTTKVPTQARSYRGSRQARREGVDWHLDDGTIDGAVIGVYEDEPPRRWVGAIIAFLLVVAIAVVGWLAYRAVQADEDTGLDAEAGTRPVQQVTSWDGTVSFTM